MIAVIMIAAGLGMTFGGFVMLLQQESEPFAPSNSDSATKTVDAVKDAGRKRNKDVYENEDKPIQELLASLSGGNAKPSIDTPTITERKNAKPSSRDQTAERNDQEGTNENAPAGPTTLTSEEKGLEFEKWVAKHFNREYFRVKEWTGDKFVDGIYAESSGNPDFFVVFMLREKEYPFAVECKWRKDFERGSEPSITWATERQIDNYRNYGRKQNAPVFVAIGVGGQPNAPHEVYVVPLQFLRNPRVTAAELAPFRRGRKEDKFFYDVKATLLR